MCNPQGCPTRLYNAVRRVPPPSGGGGGAVMVHNGDAVLERAITLNVKCHFYTFRKESTIRIVGASIVFNWQSP